ncbi:glycoside hydrolase family 43 protein [Vibrio sp. qd031]|uniref:glycoside hydrolase family 43 protein n=1 Tax=Vibrio sp. qd031 TaxID=1603038 RepID=UPI000A11DB86|nr:glycoside hydrolase family 43 protein [Vibrio sp. qd031]
MTLYNPNVVIRSFDYQGCDPEFLSPLEDDEYYNPILSGFHPDPSICRVDDDYYLICSSFCYTPGIPLYHSKDLVNWQFRCHVIDSNNALKLSPKLDISRGIFAPTIRYNQGKFYVITTAVDAGENFIVTAESADGPWSDPIYLPQIDGCIDPDIFFDDDGCIYVCHNGEPITEPLYEGHRAIWIWQYDEHTQTLIESSKTLLIDGGVEISSKPIWIEGPHLYKYQGWYYLSAAEGGTSDQHSQVIFRSRHVLGPYAPGPNNPILSQRQLDPKRSNPICAAGHADLVQTQNGDWWAVFLATRNYKETHFNTGRETFLLPVTWEDEWPLILEENMSIPYRNTKPNINSRGSQVNTSQNGNFYWKDTFDHAALSYHWNRIGSHGKNCFRLSLDSGPGIAIACIESKEGSQLADGFIGRRIQHKCFQSELVIDNTIENDCSAGLVLHQNEQHHFYIAIERQATVYRCLVEKTEAGVRQVLYSTTVDRLDSDGLHKIRVETNCDQIMCSFTIGDTTIAPKERTFDGKLLSTSVASGFVGAYVGMLARTIAKTD